jgi:hypothetical protein
MLDSLNNKLVLFGFIFFPVIAGYLAFIFEPILKFQLDKVEGRCWVGVRLFEKETCALFDLFCSM